MGGYGLMHPYREHAQGRVVDKVLGTLDPTVPQGIDATSGLVGTPDSARMLLHEPLRAARDVRVPTLIVTALDDAMMPPDVQAPLVDLIAGATRVEVEGSGHMVSIEQPAVFDSIIDGFLEARSRA